MAATEVSGAVAERLATSQLAWLTTVRADGQPQSSYVWFHFDGTDVLICSQSAAAKVRNVRSSPLVSFHLNGDDFGGQVLTMDASAAVVDDIGPERLAAYLAKYDEAIRTQLSTTPEQLRADYSTTLRITPTRIRSW
jgi:PPOX class probable F420-dependent enzyme